MSDALQALVARALAEDLGAGDLTAEAVVPAELTATAVVHQREPGVIYGVDAARETFSQAGAPGLEALAPEGEWRDPGEVARVEGAARALLAGERTALNLLGRLSGIATLTARYVQAVDGTGARILDTRKTTPGLRELEKAAVRAGGGASHRAGLHDAILVKENHAAMAGGVGEAARRAVAARGGADFVEVEIEALEELDEVLEAGVDRVLLDNMPPADMRAAVHRAGGRAELEASGGVTLESVRAIAETGVDYVSVGALTHSAPALDLSFLVAPG
jgi:nicotinate-nucleotide pyrophosphorylase (carboxylating)